MRWTSLAILVSIALHALLYRLLSREVWVTPEPKTITIEVQERKFPEGNPGANARASGSRKSHGRGISLKALRRPFDMKGAIAAGQASQIEDARGSSEWSAEHWGVRGGSLSELEHFVGYDKLMREVQGLLYYPNALEVRKISGTIHARIYFTKDSRCDRARTRVDGHHYYLKFYIMALIQKLCALETVEHMGFRENQFVDLSFAFVLTHREDRLESEKRDAINGNVMRFERIGHDVWYEYRIGPIRGIYGVPYWTLDFPWVLDKWEMWVEGRDPLDAFRE